MEIRPILSAMLRNPIGGILVAIQIALTVAIVCNALFIVHHQTQLMRRPSGLDETNIFSFYNIWSDDSDDYKAKTLTDLSTLRAMPDVEDAMVTLGLPLQGGGYSFSIALKPGQGKGVTDATLFPVDDHGMRTLGLHLASGRWFTGDEIRDLDKDHDTPEAAPVVIVTQALAERLFPKSNALGRAIYLGKGPATIIGIVERMQSSHASTSSDLAEYSVLVPYLWEGSTALYVVRAKPGKRDALMRDVPLKLASIDRTRVIAHMSSFQDSRDDAYRPVRAMAIILGSVAVLLVVITALGIIGLTSYWVSQRRRHIGIRRALGARRIDILTYFHTENLLVVSIGALIGIILAKSTNMMVVRYFEMNQLPMTYILASALVVLALGQLSVLWPALRASRISPLQAIR